MDQEEIDELLARCDLEGEQNLKKMKIDTGFSQPLKNFKVEEVEGKLVFEGDIVLDDVSAAVTKGNAKEGNSWEEAKEYIATAFPRI